MVKLLSYMAFLFSTLAVSAVNPEALGKLKKGESSDHVRELFGSPTSEDHNPDGRFVYVYEYESLKDSSDKGFVTLLFGKDRKLLKLEAFKKTDTK